MANHIVAVMKTTIYLITDYG